MGVLGSGFAGYVPLASQNPHPIIVYSVASYRCHLGHFLGKCHCAFKNGIQCEPTVNTVFNFTRPLAVFHQKKIVFRLPSIIDTIYGNA